MPSAEYTDPYPIQVVDLSHIIKPNMPVGISSPRQDPSLSQGSDSAPTVTAEDAVQQDQAIGESSAESRPEDDPFWS